MGLEEGNEVSGRPSVEGRRAGRAGKAWPDRFP